MNFDEEEHKFVYESIEETEARLREALIEVGQTLKNADGSGVPFWMQPMITELRRVVNSALERPEPIELCKWCGLRRGKFWGGAGNCNCTGAP